MLRYFENNPGCEISLREWQFFKVLLKTVGEKHGKGLRDVVMSWTEWQTVHLGTGLGKLQRDKLQIALEICKEQQVHSTELLHQIESKV